MSHLEIEWHVLRLIYMSDFRGWFHISLLHSYEQNFFAFLKTRTNLIQNRTHV